MQLLYFERIKIFNSDPSLFSAAELFCNELNSRIDSISVFSDKENADIVFESFSVLNNDEFVIDYKDGKLFFIAKGIRGAVYASGLFLRKTVKRRKGFKLIKDITGFYSPAKKIRGHQLGYRTTPNAYDAWTYEDCKRYYIDLMYFGNNTVEHIPYENGKSKRNPLMKYDEEDFLINAVEIADSLDIDVSLWHPNADGETDQSAAKIRKNLYSKLCRLNYVFVPGGDPGNLPAKEFVGRCRAISKSLKEVHPDAELWASAQAPHEYPDWGNEFAEELGKSSDGIDGIIYGPNHALPLDEFYSRFHNKFRLRFYPDITHNVRCEYPVHYDRNDWHYALCTCLGRECTNPRPREYYKLYKETEKYFAGSVSYSEGITDDVNKFLWSALDYDNRITADDAVSDYARLFFFGTDTDSVVKIIFGLEKNWEGSPGLNESIDYVYSLSCRLKNRYPQLEDNWRFLQLYFRACCDKIIRYRYVYENRLIDKARYALENGNIQSALKILNADFSREYKEIREEINRTADRLFNLIGYQSDVEHYYADNPERGAVLDTIDLPVTDREWLLSKYAECEIPSQWLRFFNRNSVDSGEYFFSVALDNVNDLQSGEPYFNFQGDRPNINKGDLPTALFNVFDNFEYRHEITGLSDDSDYCLRVTYLDRRDENVTEHKIAVNGTVIYSGSQFGDIDREFTDNFCKPGFVCASYIIPRGIIREGKAVLELSEPLMGVMFAEYRLTKTELPLPE